MPSCLNEFFWRGVANLGLGIARIRIVMIRVFVCGNVSIQPSGLLSILPIIRWVVGLITI